MMVLLIEGLASAIIGAFLSTGMMLILPHPRSTIPMSPLPSVPVSSWWERWMAGMVRDMVRYKAKKRRYAADSHALAGTSSMSLWEVLLHQDDPLDDLILSPSHLPNGSWSTLSGVGTGSSTGTTTTTTTITSIPITGSRNDPLETYTIEELEEYGDGEEGRPILIALLGRVYDVSAGSKFYGPRGQYHHFAGRDVTYSLATGCKRMECVGRPIQGSPTTSRTRRYETASATTTVGETLTLQQWAEAKRWLSYFHLHDKYAWVGRLQENIDLVEQLLQTVDDDDDDDISSPEQDSDDDERDFVATESILDLISSGRNEPSSDREKNKGQ